jgi:hypothetical protein
MVLKSACYVLDFMMEAASFLSLGDKRYNACSGNSFKTETILNYCVNIQKITSLNIS